MSSTAHSCQEKAMVLSKSNLRVKDIRVLLDCGSDKATSKAKEFRSWYENEHGYALYLGQIPTEAFIQFAGINEKRILKYAKEGY